MSEVISNRAPEPVGPYPHARRVGNLLFLSGVGPRVRGSKEIPGVTLAADGTVAAYDIELQCRNCCLTPPVLASLARVSWPT